MRSAALASSSTAATSSVAPGGAAAAPASVASGLARTRLKGALYAQPKRSTAFVCAACKREREKTFFTKTQFLQGPTKRRCEDCTFKAPPATTAAPAPGASASAPAPAPEPAPAAVAAPRSHKRKLAAAPSAPVPVPAAAAVAAPRSHKRKLAAAPSGEPAGVKPATASVETVPDGAPAGADATLGAPAPADAAPAESRAPSKRARRSR